MSGKSPSRTSAEYTVENGAGQIRAEQGVLDEWSGTVRFGAAIVRYRHLSAYLRYKSLVPISLLFARSPQVRDLWEPMRGVRIAIIDFQQRNVAVAPPEDQTGMPTVGIHR